MGSFDSSNNQPKVSPIQAILASAGVEYTHENSEVIGSSKVEASLSRRAELAATVRPDSEEEDESDNDRSSKMRSAATRTNIRGAKNIRGKKEEDSDSDFDL